MREQSTALQQTVQQNGDGHMFTGWSSQSSPSSSVSSAGLSSSSSSWLFGQLGAQLSSTATAEIQCSVNNVFPLPELTIYQVLNDGLRPRSLTNARYSQNITQLPNGAYYASVTAVIEDTELLLEQTHHPRSLHHAPGSYGPTMFECLVSQDEIRHELRKRTIYSPSSGKSLPSFHPKTLEINLWKFSLSEQKTPNMMPAVALAQAPPTNHCSTVFCFYYWPLSGNQHRKLN